MGLGACKKESESKPWVEWPSGGWPRISLHNLPNFGLFCFTFMTLNNVVCIIGLLFCNVTVGVIVNGNNRLDQSFYLLSEFEFNGSWSSGFFTFEFRFPYLRSSALTWQAILMTFSALFYNNYYLPIEAGMVSVIGNLYLIANTRTKAWIFPIKTNV